MSRGERDAEQLARFGDWYEYKDAEMRLARRVRLWQEVLAGRDHIRVTWRTRDGNTYEGHYKGAISQSAGWRLQSQCRPSPA